MKDLSAGGCKVSPLPNGCKCHMIYKVLKLFESNGVFVYALPAHISGSTQPLGLIVFGSFKEYLCGCIERLAFSFAVNSYDVFDVFS